MTNSDVFSAPAVAAAAAWNTRTATSNSLHRHSRRSKRDGKTAFMITCYHNARITPARRHTHVIFPNEDFARKNTFDENFRKYLSKRRVFLFYFVRLQKPVVSIFASPRDLTRRCVNVLLRIIAYYRRS